MVALAAIAAIAVWGPSLAAQTVPDTAPPKRTLEFSGVVLMNAFYNTARMNNSDVPQFADTNTISVSGGGAALRQTRLGLLLTEQDVFRGTFTGELDVDFFGGQLASNGGRTFPLLRIRRAVGIITWPHGQLLLGQEAPLILEKNPRSLAAIGFPAYAGSGNLWLWIPQARFTLETGVTLRLAIQAAALAPTGGVAQGPFNTQPDSAERTGRPFLQGRLRLAWGPTDDPSEIGIGGHQGWLRGPNAAGDTILSSQALAFDARIKLGEIEILGEFFAGQGLGVLGGGGIGQTIGVNNDVVHTKGGWGQLNLRVRPDWVVGGGCGIDDPDDADIGANGRLRNFVCEGHLDWRPSGPMVFGFEFRRFETEHQAGVFTASHLNLAAGYRF